MAFQARSAQSPASFEDRRMWRLLLARLHPDAGGDNDLFAFACAIRDEVSRGDRTAQNVGSKDTDQQPESAAPFLRAWQESMRHWSSSNSDALNDSSARS